MIYTHVINQGEKGGVNPDGFLNYIDILSNIYYISKRTK